MAKIFITGINGFIGRNLAKEAIEQGHSVSGIDRKGHRIGGADVWRMDVRDRRLGRLIKGNDYVFHLAAVTANLEFQKDMHECYDINVNGLNNVLESCNELPKRPKVIYASSASVYGTKLQEFSESIMLGIETDNHYAKSKMINEMVARSYTESCGLETVGARLFNTYGEGENTKGDYASIISLFLDCARRGERIKVYGDGTQARDFIFVGDAAKILLLLARRRCRHPIYNVGTGEATRFKDIAKRISKDFSYVKNPLKSYQHCTKANITRLKDAIGDFKFVRVNDYLNSRRANQTNDE